MYVPEGDYCQVFENLGLTCPSFIETSIFDEVNGTSCDLGLYGQIKDDVGIKKPQQCREFKEEN